MWKRRTTGLSARKSKMRGYWYWNTMLASRCSPTGKFIYSIEGFRNLDQDHLQRMSKKDLKYCKKHLAQELQFKSSVWSMFTWLSPLISSGCYLTLDNAFPSIGACGFGLWFLYQRNRTAVHFENNIRSIDDALKEKNRG